jgi:hypothetical protein
MVDDFCVNTPDLWQTTGQQLLDEIQRHAKQKSVIQTVIVCGHHDTTKQQFLKNQRLTIASEWYVKSI